MIMTARVATLLAGALIAGGAAAPAPAQTGESTVTDSSLRFPAVMGRSLTGRSMALPADLEGDVNLVVVAFKRHQQEDVDTWTPYLRPLAARRPALRVYELPTLSSGLGIVRSFIDGGMRRGIPDSAVRAATVTLYIDKNPFKAALEIPDEDRVQLFLVERGGRIRWRGAGRYTPEVFEQLEAALGPEAPATDSMMR
jgi:ATP synthase subunit 10